MATKIVMEALSPTMEEGRLIEWKKKEGESVAVGDVLAEVETDKAVMELVARSAGTLLKQLVAAGATVPVSSAVGWIGQPGESVDGGAAAPPAIAPAPAQRSVSHPAPPAVAPALEPSGRVKASPLAKKSRGNGALISGRLPARVPRGASSSGTWTR